MKLLNNTGFFDEIGFAIYYFGCFFDHEKDYIEFLSNLQTKCDFIYDRYGPRDIRINSYENLCIKSFDGVKKIMTEELCMVQILYSYFNDENHCFLELNYFGK